MKTFTKILMMAAILVLVNSCTDIADLGNNTVKIPILPQISKEDSLNLLDVTTIDLGDVRWHRLASQNVIINNNSDGYTVIIYSIKLKNNFGFDLSPENGFPIVIPPKQNNANNQLIAKWDTDIVTIGSYQDTVYINGSQQKWWVIKGNVTN